MVIEHVAFLALVLGTEAFFTGLTGLNLRHGARALADRADAAADLGVEDPDEVVAYQRARAELGRLEAWIVLAFVLGLLYLGILGDLARLAGSLSLGTVAVGVVFLVAVAAIVWLVHLPFAAVRTFRIEERFGFNRQTPTGFARDAALQLAIGLGVTAIVAAALVGLVVHLPDLWWVAGAGGFVAFVLAAQVVYPRLIAPLFFEFEPVEDAELRSAVEAVLERAGVGFEGIHVMDASTRTAHANAYFVGFGPEKRIVLYDTMIESMTVEEIQAVLAHELAHWTRAHVWKNVAWGAIGVGVTLLVVDLLMAWPGLVRMFGLPATPYAALLAAGVWVVPLRRWLSPLAAWRSRRHEREADDVAKEIVGDGEPLVDALVELTSGNMANPYPHPWHVIFHASHPPLPERVGRLRD